VITASVGLRPHIGWSAGDLFERVGRPRDRTYCRFALGVYSQQQISDGKAPLHRFKALRTVPSFFESGGRLSVYFKNMDSAPEFYLNLLILDELSAINASVVFR
jgi:hypothetical protein